MADPEQPDAVIISPQAERDLDALVDHLVVRDPVAAARFLTRFEEAVDLLASRVVEGRRVVLGTGERYRRWFMHPVSIFYERAGGVVRIVRVYHHAHLPFG